MVIWLHNDLEDLKGADYYHKTWSLDSCTVDYVWFMECTGDLLPTGVLRQIEEGGARARARVRARASV